MLNVFTYEWNYRNIVNSNIFVLLELEKKQKLHILWKNLKRRDETVVLLASPAPSAAWGKLFLLSVKFCQIQCVTKISNYFPMFTLQNAVFSVNNGEDSVGKSGNIFWRERSHVALLEWRDTIDSLLEINVIHSRKAFQQQQICQLQPKTFVFSKQWVKWSVIED